VSISYAGHQANVYGRHAVAVSSGAFRLRAVHFLETFARFLVPEIRKYYDSELGQREFAEWQEAQGKTK
jgi:hypothetical protein